MNNLRATVTPCGQDANQRGGSKLVGQFAEAVESLPQLARATDGTRYRWTDQADARTRDQNEAGRGIRTRDQTSRAAELRPRDGTDDGQASRP